MYTLIIVGNLKFWFAFIAWCVCAAIPGSASASTVRTLCQLLINRTTDLELSGTLTSIKNGEDKIRHDVILESQQFDIVSPEAAKSHIQTLRKDATYKELIELADLRDHTAKHGNQESLNLVLSEMSEAYETLLKKHQIPFKKSAYPVGEFELLPYGVDATSLPRELQWLSPYTNLVHAGGKKLIVDIGHHKEIGHSASSGPKSIRLDMSDVLLYSQPSANAMHELRHTEIDSILAQQIYSPDSAENIPVTRLMFGFTGNHNAEIARRLPDYSYYRADEIEANIAGIRTSLEHQRTNASGRSEAQISADLDRQRSTLRIFINEQKILLSDLASLSKKQSLVIKSDEITINLKSGELTFSLKQLVRLQQQMTQKTITTPLSDEQILSILKSQARVDLARIQKWETDFAN